jgi:uncharacterized membrane protein
MGKSTASNPSKSSMGENIADTVTSTVGSWKFIIIQSSLLSLWIIVNVISWIKHWDEYPFILLNLALSFQAAYATPFILMSQNRQAQIDRIRAEQDFDIDTQAEKEIESLHQKIDGLKDIEIAELNRMLTIQNQTIQRLEVMLSHEIDINH